MGGGGAYLLGKEGFVIFNLFHTYIYIVHSFRHSHRVRVLVSGVCVCVWGGGGVFGSSV